MRLQKSPRLALNMAKSRESIQGKNTAQDCLCIATKAASCTFSLGPEQT